MILAYALLRHSSGAARGEGVAERANIAVSRAVAGDLRFGVRLLFHLEGVRLGRPGDGLRICAVCRLCRDAGLAVRAVLVQFFFLFLGQRRAPDSIRAAGRRGAGVAAGQLEGDGVALQRALDLKAVGVMVVIIPRDTGDGVLIFPIAAVSLDGIGAILLSRCAVSAFRMSLAGGCLFELHIQPNDRAVILNLGAIRVRDCERRGGGLTGVEVRGIAAMDRAGIRTDGDRRQDFAGLYGRGFRRATGRRQNAVAHDLRSADQMRALRNGAVQIALNGLHGDFVRFGHDADMIRPAAVHRQKDHIAFLRRMRLCRNVKPGAVQLRDPVGAAGRIRKCVSRDPGVM